MRLRVPILLTCSALSIPAYSASTSRYAAAQADALEEAAKDEGDEGDPLSQGRFEALAKQARESGPVTVEDLPAPWREEVRRGRRDTSENRDHAHLVRVEKRLAGLSVETRERYADKVAHAEVDTFRAREELSEKVTLKTWAGDVLDHADADLAGIGADRDGDGILDVDDRCPDDPEDRDGFEDSDGCPDPDNDRDGIPDVRDRCPNEPETKNGIQDEDGCPDADGDRDHDGIPDSKDLCPDVPETKNGVEDEDGCPELMPVYFASDSSRLDAEAIETLAADAEVLKQQPDLAIRLEGHCDSQNSDAYNYRLGQRRADAVKEYLTKYLGISDARLETSSAGEGSPAADNSTPRGRHLNRRVELKTQSNR